MARKKVSNENVSIYVLIGGGLVLGLLILVALGINPQLLSGDPLVPDPAAGEVAVEPKECSDYNKKQSVTIKKDVKDILGEDKTSAENAAIDSATVQAEEACDKNCSVWKKAHCPKEVVAEVGDPLNGIPHKWQKCEENQDCKFTLDDKKTRKNAVQQKGKDGKWVANAHIEGKCAFTLACTPKTETASEE